MNRLAKLEHSKDAEPPRIKNWGMKLACVKHMLKGYVIERLIYIQSSWSAKGNEGTNIRMWPPVTNFTCTLQQFDKFNNIH